MHTPLFCHLYYNSMMFLYLLGPILRLLILLIFFPFSLSLSVEILSPSSTEKQVISAMILYPVIALVSLLVIAVTVVAIFLLRKRLL